MTATEFEVFQEIAGSLDAVAGGFGVFCVMGCAFFGSATVACWVYIGRSGR